MARIIPCLGNISCLVETALYQYSPPKAGLGVPCFLNGSNQNTGSLRPGNNGAYGLRFFWSNLYPYDGSGNLVQFAGGTIGQGGVWNFGTYLNNLSQYRALSPSNGSYYLLADCPDGSVIFDAGNSQVSGGPWKSYKVSWPAELPGNNAGRIPAPQLNNTLETSFTVNWDGHVNQYDMTSKGWQTWTRHPQYLGGGSYSPLLYWGTLAGTFQGQPIQAKVPTFAGLSSQYVGGFNLAGVVDNTTYSIQNSNGTGIYYDHHAGAMKCVSNYLCQPMPGGFDIEQVSPILQMENQADDTQMQTEFNINGAIVPGGHYLFAPKNSARYFLILSDLSGYYGVNFSGVDALSSAALIQNGGPNGGFGMDNSGNFWFQGDGDLLYSSLGLASFKVFNGGNYSPLPFINQQSLDCRRLLTSANITWEG